MRPEAEEALAAFGLELRRADDRALVLAGEGMELRADLAGMVPRLRPDRLGHELLVRAMDERRRCSAPRWRRARARSWSSAHPRGRSASRGATTRCCSRPPTRLSATERRSRVCATCSRRTWTAASSRSWRCTRSSASTCLSSCRFRWRTWTRSRGCSVASRHARWLSLLRGARHRRLRHLPQRLPLLLRQQGPPSRVRELPPARSGKPTAHRPSASGGHRHAGRPEEPARATSAPSGCIYPVLIVTWSCGSTREAARDSGLRSGCRAAR